MKKGRVHRSISMPFVLLQERNDLQLHGHDSLHVDDEIREEIYAAKKRHVNLAAHRRSFDCTYFTFSWNSSF